MAKYWNGYKWCEDPPMGRAEPSPTIEERSALLEAEVNPPDETGEHEPVEQEATIDWTYEEETEDA